MYEPHVKEIALRHHKTPSQVFDFELTPEEVQTLSTCGRNERLFKALAPFTAKELFARNSKWTISPFCEHKAVKQLHSISPSPPLKMKNHCPYVPLQNGFQLPMVGLGTAQPGMSACGLILYYTFTCKLKRISRFKTSPSHLPLSKVLDENAEAAVSCALDAGYRLIDTAPFYENEAAIGRALHQKCLTSDLRREDVFITTKLRNSEHGVEHVRPACERSLRKLGLSYLDLYLIHWPVAFVVSLSRHREHSFPFLLFNIIILPYFQYEGEEIQKDLTQPRPVDPTPLEDTWKEMEKLVDARLVRSIGLSNFNCSQINRILKICRIRPQVLQVEVSLLFRNRDLVAFAKSVGMQVTGYATFGSPGMKQFMGKICLSALSKLYNFCLIHQRDRPHLLFPGGPLPERNRGKKRQDPCPDPPQAHATTRCMYDSEECQSGEDSRKLSGEPLQARLSRLLSREPRQDTIRQFNRGASVGAHIALVYD
ncbi:unnamed protein product [Schistocephalus solidus]|uniref:Aldo_ket_red domain-containing protein n=1 Tax=Schistocephalus solidus TaxID=70667 RepID=A0A183SQN4_SCHSO|nr:unnamed protein product [Schistocephalus solidus]